MRLYGDPCLRKKSVPLQTVGVAQRLLVKSMFETMRHHKGVGLAAPQVGINQRIFVVDIGQGPWAFFNLKVLQKTGAEILEEGCLSIPGINLKIKRANKILVSYLDENNNLLKATFTGLMARVVQHENDHLDGKLIIDYANLLEKRKIKKQLAAGIETKELKERRN